MNYKKYISQYSCKTLFRDMKILAMPCSVFTFWKYNNPALFESHRFQRSHNIRNYNNFNIQTTTKKIH